MNVLASNDREAYVEAPIAVTTTIRRYRPTRAPRLRGRVFDPSSPIFLRR
jgi:hypothetical protein